MESQGIKKLVKNKGTYTLTRKKVEPFVENMTDELFMDVFELPFKPVQTPMCLLKIEYVCESQFVAGRYLKLQRGISQTPWLVGKKRKADTSVSEFFEASLNEHYQATEVKFVSAGREDADVLMLGTGRPFLLEFKDPKKLTCLTYTDEDAAKWQEAFNARHHGVVEVRDLCIVDGRKACETLKEGEESKSKSYR